MALEDSRYFLPHQINRPQKRLHFALFQRDFFPLFQVIQCALDDQIV